MIPNISWGEMLILLVAALVILGPERLPGAIRWAFVALRRVRDYATGATQQLRDEIGPEFDELREPLQELQRLRGMTPRSVITKHLLDGDDSVLRDVEAGLSGRDWGAGAIPSADHDLYSGVPPSPRPAAGGRPPIDGDAT